MLSILSFEIRELAELVKDLYNQLSILSFEIRSLFIDPITKFLSDLAFNSLF